MATNPTPITNSVTASATASSAKPNILQTIIAHKTLEVAERRVKNELVLKDRAQGLVEDLDYLKFAIANFPEYQQLTITPLRLSQTKVSAGFSKNSVLFKQKQQLVQAIAELDAEGLWFSELP